MKGLNETTYFTIQKIIIIMSYFNLLIVKVMVPFHIDYNNWRVKINKVISAKNEFLRETISYHFKQNYVKTWITPSLSPHKHRFYIEKTIFKSWHLQSLWFSFFNLHFIIINNRSKYQCSFIWDCIHPC